MLVLPRKARRLARVAPLLLLCASFGIGCGSKADGDPASGGSGSAVGGGGGTGSGGESQATGGGTSGGATSGGVGSGGKGGTDAGGGASTGGKSTGGAGGSAAGAGGEAGGAGGAGDGTGGAATGTGACYDEDCQGTCEGTCGDGFVCNTERVVCTADIAEFCGCDGETFEASSSCPQRAYQYQGACRADPGVNCDARDIVCLPIVAPEPCPQGEVYSVSPGGCYGACVAIDLCACSSSEECPDPNGNDEFTCLTSRGRCSYWLK